MKVAEKRPFFELIAVITVLVFGLSVFTLGGRSKTSLTFDNGQITYTGYVKNHRMNGKGRLVYDNGDVYEGHFVNGVFNGQGTFTSSTGWTYEGQFKNGQADGKGILTAKDGKVYEGTFKQGIYQK